jgi:hypothetical protein
MEGFDPNTSFGYETSKRYDVLETRGDEEETVAFLAQLAGQRDALEFAIGTGRIALPLMRAGVRVDGIEQSRHMVDRMREKPEQPAPGSSRRVASARPRPAQARSARRRARAPAPAFAQPPRPRSVHRRVRDRASDTSRRSRLTRPRRGRARGSRAGRSATTWRTRTDRSHAGG